MIYLRMGSWFRVNAICDIVQEKLIFWSRIDSLILWFQLDTRYQSKYFLILIMTVYEIQILVEIQTSKQKLVLKGSSILIVTYGGTNF